MEQLFENVLKSSISEILTETGLGDSVTTRTSGKTEPEIMVTIGLTGLYQGYIMIKGKREQIFGLMEKMIKASGLTVEIADKKEIYTEAFKEFTNQISGRIAMKLAEEEINCNITPPTMIEGSKISIELGQFPVYIELEIGNCKSDTDT